MTKKMKLKRWITFYLALVVIAISAFLLPIFIKTKPFIVPFSSKVANTPTNTSPSQQIFIANHGWHTGIIVPADALRQRLPDLAARFPYYDWLEIGWGDAGFYQNETITIALTLNAVLTPSDTVMHVVGFDGEPSAMFYQSEVIAHPISTAQLDNVLTFIDNSFAKNQADRLITQANGRYGDSQFYRAVGKYYAFNTCNKWTAKALVSAGIDIGTAYKLTASSVMNGLK